MDPGFEINDGETFACLAFKNYCPMPIAGPDPVHLGDGNWLSKSLPFPLNERCRGQLGKHAAQELERANLVLVAKRVPSVPDVPPTDANIDVRRVTYLHYGLAVWACIPKYQDAILLLGGHDDGGVGVVEGERQYLFHGSCEAAKNAAVVLAPMERLEAAVDFAVRLEGINAAHEADYKTGAKPPKFWRVISGVTAFLDACRSYRYEVRMHQYVRAIESFLPPSVSGAKSFAEKASLLCTPKNALEEMYRLRNKAEHHEYFEDAKLCGGKPEDAARSRVSQAEALCVELYRRLFTKNADFLRLYETGASIENFWSNDSLVRKQWGEPFVLQ